MRMISYILVGWLLIMGTTASAQLQRNSLIRDAQQTDFDEDREEEVAGSGFGYFLKAAQDTPEEQYEYAKSLEDEGELKKAARAYRALVKIWPSFREAGMAQFRFARIQEDIRHPQKAAEAYEYLLTYYTGAFPHQTALQRLFDLGVQLMNDRKADFLFFPGFKAPERAIPAFENVVRFGPRWEGAAEAQYLIGQAHQSVKNYEEALQAYEVTQVNYPDSPWAEEAAYHTLQTLFVIAEEVPNSEAALEEAWISSVLFRDEYPNSKHMDAVQAYQDTLLRRRAFLAYEQARYYDELARRPDAALQAYEDFIRQFPNSEWSDIAEVRIQTLRTQKSRATGEDQG